MISFEDLLSYLELPMVQRAFIVTGLISICAAFIGVTLVLKRLSNIGDGLSHVAFFGFGLAILTSVTDKVFIILPVTFAAAFLLIRTRNNKKLKGDSLIAMLSVGALALTYFLLNVFNSSSNVAGDVCSTLFGSSAILTLSNVDVWISISLCAVTTIIYILFYNKIFVVTFDDKFARASGIKVEIYEIAIALSIALIVTISINLVGSLLVTALLVFPSISAMRICRRYKSVIIVSVIISVVNSIFGMLLSIMLSAPVGPTIVIIEAVVFLACLLIGFIKGARA